LTAYDALITVWAPGDRLPGWIDCALANPMVLLSRWNEVERQLGASTLDGFARTDGLKLAGTLGVEKSSCAWG